MRKTIKDYEQLLAAAQSETAQWESRFRQQSARADAAETRLAGAQQDWQRLNRINQEYDLKARTIRVLLGADNE